jgi:hypothetical protein
MRGALGYEPFAYLRGRLSNPAAVLLAALCQSDLPARVVEALPWLALHFPDLNRDWLVERAKLHDVQNRLGYVVTLAAQVAGAGVAPRLFALDPYDLVLTKLERNSLRDREDVFHLAKAIPLDTAVLRMRYEDEMRASLGNPDREDLTLRLWIEAIEEERSKNGS